MSTLNITYSSRQPTGEVSTARLSGLRAQAFLAELFTRIHNSGNRVTATLRRGMPWTFTSKDARGLTVVHTITSDHEIKISPDGMKVGSCGCGPKTTS